MKQPRSLYVGLENEFFVLDHEGNVVNNADIILRALSKKDNKREDITHEAAKCLIEIRAPPSRFIHKTALSLLQNTELALQHAQTTGHTLLPLGTYPGKTKPLMRQQGTYRVKEKILGKKRFETTGRCAGFHCHYDLPFTIPLVKRISLLQFLDVRREHALVEGYNFATALDPALTSFMQSSPFYQGEYLGKDSRMLAYRGSPALHYPAAAYAKYPEFGQLQGYKHSLFEITEMIDEKFSEWKKNILDLRINIKTLSLYGSLLETAWNPVKINQLGTLEQRGMDMNLPQQYIAATVMITSILQRVYDEQLVVVPDAVDAKMAFTVERQMLHVPPDTFVCNTLQLLSATKGIEDKNIFNYCKNLMKLTKHSVNNKESRPFLEPFKQILDEKTTTSDHILNLAKRQGWKEGEALSQPIAANIALTYSNYLLKDILLTKTKIEDIDK